MSVEEILKEIANFGFSFINAVYLLMVFGNNLNRLPDAFEKLYLLVECLGKR